MFDRMIYRGAWVVAEFLFFRPAIAVMRAATISIRILRKSMAR